MNNPHERLATLYKQSHQSLLNYAFRYTKNVPDAEELVSTLYEYLLKKDNEKIHWKDSYNIRYCQMFIHSRFINEEKKKKSFVEIEGLDFEEQEPYDEDFDRKVDKAMESILKELEELQQTKQWAKGRIFQMYMLSDKKLAQVAEDIKVSKSTVLLAVKKIKKHLVENIENPFNKNKEI